MSPNSAPRAEIAKWFPGSEALPGARLRLFCLPHAGGGAAVYYHWRRQFSPAVQVCPLRLPGRESLFSEAPVRRVDELIAVLSDLIMLRLTMPYALFGHSLGALLAFELARELRRRGAAAPAVLLLSGMWAPQLPDEHPPIHSLGDEKFVDAICSRYGGIPKELLNEPAALKLFLPVLRADLELLETWKYRHEEPLDIPVIAFGGSNDPVVPSTRIEAWAAQTSGSFRSHLLPGGHFFLHDASERFLSLLRGYVESLGSPSESEQADPKVKLS